MSIEIATPPYDTRKDGCNLLATIRLYGVEHHLEFIRVRPGGPGRDCQVAYSDNDDDNAALDDLFRLYEVSAFQTVNVPGFEGDFVACMHPFDD